MTVDPQPALVATNINVSCQKLLARIPHLAWLMSEGGEILTGNQLWSEYIGRSRAEEIQLLGKSYVQISTNDTTFPKSCNCCQTFSDLLHERDRMGFEIAWLAASKALEPLAIELRLSSTIGEWEWFQVELEPDRDRSGAIVWIGTAQRLDSEALMPRQQQSTQFLEALLAYASDGIVACDAQGRLVLFNQTALNFGGIAAEDAIGHKFWEVPGWRFSPAIQQQLAAQGEFFRCKIELTGADDRTIPIDFSLSPIRNDLGEVTMLIPEGRDLSQIEQAERDRHRVERYTERLATALKVANAGAWYWELSDNKLDWTREFEALFDYEPGSTQKIYSEWAQRIHPDDLQRVENITQETIAGRLPQHRCEYRVVCRDGSIRWVDGIGEIGTDEAGKTYLAGLVRDITDRKRDEEALRRSEEFKRRILASNNDCIKVFDLAGRLLYMNHGGLSMLEIADFSTIANQPWHELWQGHETANIETALDAARVGNTGRFEGFCPTATSKPKWWEVVVTPILDADGRVEQILGVSRDITERRQAAIALQASEELFRHTFEYTPVGFAHVAPNGQLLRVNRKFCEIIGYSNAELLTLTFHDITEPADLAEDVALVDRLLADEIQEYTLEKRYIHKRGHHVWVSLTVSLVRAESPDGQLGTPKYFLSAVQDITHRKQLEFINHQQTTELQQLNSSLLLTQQKLKERNDELDNFVRIASHDLKAPLRAIANLADWIEDDMTDRLTIDDRQQFELLRQRVHRMNALVDGLLRYSRLGREELPIEQVDVSRLIAETIDSLAPPPNFAIEIGSLLPMLNTKRILLSQVFANLLSNAIKHHHRDNGRIEITAEDLGDRYQFSIADDGPGIPPGEARERIFEIFQTLKPSSSTDNTGIGLALVKKIIEGEGGRIWLTADRPQGACFCFTWPKKGE
jgi:PAS domain S-box-containing protein